jgi:hypothetical protein
VTADILALAQQAPAGIVPGDTVAWRAELPYIGGPWIVDHTEPGIVVVRRPLRGRGKRQALWSVNAGHVERLERQLRHDAAANGAGA